MASPDIFLSYNREDASRARHFADAFAAAGFTVWWDAALRSGEAYDQVTEEALATARAVVVLWSPRSVVSRWVRAEATEAERNGTLLPVMIEPCKRPIMFELVQTAELTHWHGEMADPAWRDFLAHVRAFVGKEAARDTGAPGPAKAGQASVVVLPFANMSADPEQEYFADGISEDIITDLSKVSSLLVIARNTAFTFKGRHVDVAEVARQLNVTHVLEGSVRKAGNRIRVTAQLIDGASGGHVWADRYDRHLDDIFALQDELSKAIVSALKLKLLPGERNAIEDRGTASPEAYRHYKRARALRATHSAGGFGQAVEAYRAAIDLDPGFAKAWAGLSTALMFANLHLRGADKRQSAEQEHAFARALELAPGDPDVVACRSTRCLFSFDWAEAERCLALFRGLAGEAWSVHGHLLLALGRAEDAVAAQRAVFRQDPLSIGAAAVLQYNLDCAGRIDEADEEYAACRDLPGGKDFLEWVSVLRMLALKDHARLRQRFDAAFGDGASRFSAASPAFPWTASLARMLDSPAEALAHLRQVFEESATSGANPTEAVAGFATYFGDHDLAFAALRREVVERHGSIQFLWHPALRQLRQDPRFKQILVDVGLADHWRASDRWGDYVRPLGDGDFEITG